MNSRHGFTLVEPLVALVVLTVGLVGAAGMLFASLRDQGEALHRAIAVTLALDLAERMRANPLARAAYAGVSTGASARDCTMTPCTSAQLASFDVLAWRAEAARQLPPPAEAAPTAIEFEAGGSTSPDRYRITLRWREGSASSADLAELVHVVYLFTPAAT
jgi:type IV pilus assembly protein PilV